MVALIVSLCALTILGIAYIRSLGIKTMRLSVCKSLSFCGYSISRFAHSFVSIAFLRFAFNECIVNHFEGITLLKSLCFYRSGKQNLWWVDVSICTDSMDSIMVQFTAVW